MQGKLIVIEGLDGSGKATQTELLYKRLQNLGKNVWHISFPEYNSESSALVKMYLSGYFGLAPTDVNAYAASSFYAVDRYASYKKKCGSFYENGGIIIADRYTTSNAIHQCSKLPKEEWNTFLDWLFNYEYQLLGIPSPNLTVYLRIDPKVSQKLITSRYKGNDEKKDIHERNVEYLNHCYIAANYCAEALGWKIIDCTSGEKVKTIEDIQNELIQTLKDNVVL